MKSIRVCIRCGDHDIGDGFKPSGYIHKWMIRKMRAGKLKTVVHDVMCERCRASFGDVWNYDP